MLRTVLHLHRHVEPTTVHHQRAHLEHRPTRRVVEVRKAHEVVRQIEHVRLAEDELLRLADVVKHECRVGRLGHQRLHRIREPVVQVRAKSVGPQCLQHLGGPAGEPLPVRREERLHLFPVVLRQRPGRPSQRRLDRFAPQLVELLGVVRVDLFTERQHPFRRGRRQGCGPHQQTDGGGVAEVGLVELVHARTQSSGQRLVERHGLALGEELVDLIAKRIELRIRRGGVGPQGHHVGPGLALGDVAACEPFEVGARLVQEVIERRRVDPVGAAGVGHAAERRGDVGDEPADLLVLGRLRDDDARLADGVRLHPCLDLAHLAQRDALGVGRAQTPQHLAGGFEDAFALAARAGVDVIESQDVAALVDAVVVLQRLQQPEDSVTHLVGEDAAVVVGIDEYEEHTVAGDGVDGCADRHPVGHGERRHAFQVACRPDDEVVGTSEPLERHRRGLVHEWVLE